MKYSIRGNLNMSDGVSVVSLLNHYELWHLKIHSSNDRFTTGTEFGFEAWVNTEQEKTDLFNALKPFVDEYGEEINWHLCSHDEPFHTPCVPSEIYNGR